MVDSEECADAISVFDTENEDENEWDCDEGEDGTSDFGMLYFTANSDGRLTPAGDDDIPAQFVTGPFTAVVTAIFAGTPADPNRTPGGTYPSDYAIICASDYQLSPDEGAGGDVGTGWALVCDAATGSLSIVVGTGATTAPTYIKTKATSYLCTSQTWQTYVVTYAAGIFNVYVNNVYQLAPSAAITGLSALAMTIPSPATAANIPADFSVGNNNQEEMGWQGGMVDFAWFNYTLSAAQIASLLPFTYRSMACTCNTAAGFEFDTQSYSQCTNFQETDPIHWWEFGGEDGVDDEGDSEDFDAEGTYVGSPATEQYSFNYEDDDDFDVTNFAAGEYATGTFSGMEFGSAQWTVTSWFQRNAPLGPNQAVLCGTSSTCIGFNPASTSQFGLFQQNNSANGVYVTTSGSIGSLFWIAVQFVDGWNNVTVTVREIATVTGTSTWTTATGKFFHPNGAMTGFLLGAQTAVGSNQGSMSFQDVRFFSRWLTWNELNAIGGVTSSATGVPGITAVSGSNTGGGGTGNTGGGGTGNTGGGGTGNTGGGGTGNTGGGGASSTGGGGNNGGNSTSSATVACSSAALLTIIAGAAAL